MPFTCSIGVKHSSTTITENTHISFTKQVHISILIYSKGNVFIALYNINYITFKYFHINFQANIAGSLVLK